MREEYKLKETMAIAIGLMKCYHTISTAETCSVHSADVVIYYYLFILDVADTGIFMKGGKIIRDRSLIMAMGVGKLEGEPNLKLFGVWHRWEGSF